MSYCRNEKCRKKLSILSRKRRCITCGRKFCKQCFIIDQDNIEILSSKGYCCECYVANNPNRIEYPEMFGHEYPSRQSFQNHLQLRINILEISPYAKYKIVKRLGKGQYAIVYLVQTAENKHFALKELKTGTERSDVLEEVNMSYNTTYQNIVKVYEVYYFSCQYSIIMERMDSTLDDFKEKINTADPNLICYIFREITKGIKHLHSLGLIHRDLKPENIFINKTGEIKLGDFGISAQLTREKLERITFAGSPYWMAPEIILGESYTTTSDIWSLGMIFLSLLENRIYFSNCTSLFHLRNIMASKKEPKLDQSFPQDFQQFTESCLKHEPSQRLSAEDLLNLPVFSQVSDESAKSQILFALTTNQ